MADWTTYAAAAAIGLVVGIAIGLRVFLAQRRRRIDAERAATPRDDVRG